MTPSSQTSQPHTASGFTIIELLVVITIIALMAGAVAVVVTPNSPNKQLEREARRLRAVISMVADEAIFQGEEYGFSLYQDGYQFYKWDQPDPMDALVADASQSDMDETSDTGYEEALGESGGGSPPADLQPGQWVLVEGGSGHKGAGSYELPEWIGLELSVEGEDVILGSTPSGAPAQAAEEGKSSFAPALLLLSSGEVTPFTITLTLADKDPSPSYTLKGSLMGEIKLRVPGEPDDG